MLKNISRNKVFGGWHKQYTHQSFSNDCTMQFAIYLPPNASETEKVPVIYWLSGLTCTDENFMQKAGAFKKAAELGIAIVAPDTSPRGESVADDDGYDLGQGAGFYVNASQTPWSEHYQMYDYITKELPQLIESNFPVLSKKAISGHSMGGHGALVIGLRNSGQYSSISAFSPICNPINCPWGQKAFSAYLGEDSESWKQYDASELLKLQARVLPILIDQGEADPFLIEQLKTESVANSANDRALHLKVRMQPEYDHSYYFISTFIDEHIMFHAEHLFS